MNRNSMQYAIAVYEEKNMTKAAIKLFVTQPSLSQSIKQLEEELGVQLFDRTKTPIVVTKAGEEFVHWARQVLSSEQDMRLKLYEMSEKYVRPLTIGISTHKTHQLLPEILRNFYAASNGATVILKEYTSRELGYMLERGSIDLLIDQPYHDSLQFKSFAITNERLLIAAPSSWRFTAIDDFEFPSIDAAELRDKPLIYQSENEQFNKIVELIYRHVGQIPNIVLECQSPLTAHIMVSYNIGMTIISEVRLVNNRLPGVSYYALHDIPMNRVVAVTYRKDRPLSDEAALFVKLALQECAEFNDASF